MNTDAPNFQMQPSDSGIGSGLMIDESKSDALILYQQGLFHTNKQTKEDFQRAIKLYESAIEADPFFTAAYAEIATCYTELYRLYECEFVHLENARKAANSAIETGSLESCGYRSMAVVFLHSGEPVKAIEMVEKAIAIDPNDFYNHFQAGFIYGEMSQHRKAAESYEYSIQLKPDSLISYSNLVLHYEHLGLKENAKQTAIKGLPYYEEYLKDHASDQSIRMWYSSLLGAAGRIEECLEEAKKLLSSNDVGSGILYNIACTFIRQGYNNQGLEILKSSLSAGFMGKEVIITDSDLDPVRGTPEFEKLVNAL